MAKPSERGVDHPLHLASRLRKEYSYTSPPLWAFMACSRVHFTFTESFVQDVTRFMISIALCKCGQCERPIQDEKDDENSGNMYLDLTVDL